MPSEFEDCALMKFLSKDRDYHARVLMLRKELEKWLQYTISMFPHYTSHARDHSEQIILQLSQLLFRKKKPTIALSYAEAYVLTCAAFLHDSGMVVPPSEAEEILGSARWRQFTTGEGNGAAWWKEIQELRGKQTPSAPDISAYRADLQLRLLLAEFIRREHHLRARLVLQLHPALQQLVDFNDRRYFEVIATVAEAHGMNRSELNDPSRFKEVANLGGEQVNIQFLARLLRIGDLLDLRAGRADPYSCAATSALPQSSKPHWQQYSTIIHERVDPSYISYECECQDQDTHALLRDWFGWLVEEVRETGLAMLHAERHSDWKPPKCTIDDAWVASSRNRSNSPTIIIRPAKDATYTFHHWKLELDQEKVLDRLIYDVYATPETFIRELLQNALDATRCRMYEDFSTRYLDAVAPTQPTQFPKDFLEEYSIKVSITPGDVSQEIGDTADGDKASQRQVFTIEDMGIGMDSITIRRYFLQVGRSFYQSDDFRSRYKFTPTSRFGVGFLSVFAVSSLVSVETARHPLPVDEPYGLRLTLRGPKSYLLTDRCTPFEARPPSRRHGTRIRVALDEPLPKGRLTQLIHDWCRRVEVPVEVTDFDTRTTVFSERILDRNITLPSRLNPQARFEIRSFPISEEGLEGEVFRLSYTDERGESWVNDWDHTTDISGKLIDSPPELPASYTAFHGILLGRTEEPFGYGSAWSLAIDDRRPSTQTTLARTSRSQHEVLHQQNLKKKNQSPHDRSSLSRIAQGRIQTAIADHLRTEPRALLEDRWSYSGRILSDPAVSPEFAWHWPETIPVEISHARRFFSAKEASHLPLLTVLFKERRHKREATSAPPTIEDVPVAHFRHMPLFFKQWILNRLKEGSFQDVRIFGETEDNHWVAITLAPPHTNITIPFCALAPFHNSQFYLLTMADTHQVKIANPEHPIIQWALSLVSAVETKSSKITPSMAMAVFKNLMDLSSDTFDEFLSKWRKQPDLPDALKPPPAWDWHKLYRGTIRLV